MHFNDLIESNFEKMFGADIVCSPKDTSAQLGQLQTRLFPVSQRLVECPQELRFPRNHGKLHGHKHDVMAVASKIWVWCSAFEWACSDQLVW